MSGGKANQQFKEGKDKLEETNQRIWAGTKDNEQL